MRCVANFDVGSDVSVVADDLVLTINDPHGKFKARIKNIPRLEFSTPFLLSIHIYFDAPTLDVAQDIAEDFLTHCLNMLALTTGSGFRKHRIRQIVDAELSLDGPMRDVLMWADKVEYEDPQPFLNEENAKSIERLLEFEVPAAMRRALRWYRLGVDAESPSDQFTYFWFALEILAEFRKPTTKVNDKCPHCQSPLFCETCNKYPEHRPYAKQAIQDLMRSVDANVDDSTVRLLDTTRNRLMHGSTLKEIESELPDPHESIVDILGRILRDALIMQFPNEVFDEQVIMGVPSTYVHYKVNALAGIQTVVPIDEDGHFDLEFTGTTFRKELSGPPQSAAPFVVAMTQEQYDQLISLNCPNRDHQAMLDRIQRRVLEKNGCISAQVLATDMSLIKRALANDEDGQWQRLFREILRSNDNKG